MRFIQLEKFLRKQKQKIMATQLKTTPENKVSPKSSPLGDGKITPETKASTQNSALVDVSISGSVAVLEALIAEGVTTTFSYRRSNIDNISFLESICA